MIYPAVDKVLAGEPAINLEDNVIDVSTADGFAQGVILYDQPDVVEQFKHLGVKPPKVPPPIAYLEMIEVKESKQGRGHGGKLLEAFMREAAKYADRIFLHATPSGGPYGKPELLQAAKDLIGFYKMHGFKVLREGGSDAIMWRQLPGFPTVESVLAGYVAPDSNLPSEPHFLYHGTTVDRLADIKESGVVVHGPSWGTAQDTWPDGSTEPRSYWSSRADMVWHFVPEHGQPAVIRTPRTEHFKREIGSDFYIGETVPVSRLQVLTDEGWGPLTDNVQSILAAGGNIYWHVTPTKNVPSILRDGLKPAMDKRGKGFENEPAAIYLFKTEDDAEDGVANWLGDLYDEEEPLALLKVTLPEGLRCEDDPELDLSAVRVLDPIPPESVEVVAEDW